MDALKERPARKRAASELRKDKRRNKRVSIALSGRFLAEGTRDHGVLTRNISCGGACFVSRQKPPLETRIVCYLDDLGRIESDVVRMTEDGFAVRFNVTARKKDKIADRLTWLANKKPLGLEDDRVAPRYAAGGPALVSRADGRVLQCRTIDISLTGAAFESEGPAPFIGELVTVGHLKGEVVRTLRNGFAIRYIPKDHAS
ncbi:PilZ domain-containing protein [Henriciella marina]|uniref:PilZ domain-containing protein n=1 Tax=Henriciella marina TaxID=453851 RepID=UPI0003A9C255|nr:PilZ domain-containing protein [Henriciella marina]